MANVATRADDDRLLAMLGMRRGGGTARAIAGRFGVSAARVSQLTDAVRAADLAESGELSLRVASAYWPVRAKGAADARR